ncbi:hypothetical protein [Desulfosporosinus youngiae]|uniref:Uncharacterized protein n=1 Tax=Desulfosporosinus youngiae DSM 17734 TaxID=768710 RepID=H5XTE4_9FIRM|nr:hypothetical protein [Desulfosporosinus youngiae]EHQ88403.1 hypothetical protein DesyoDRAFT_1235 [Desulfosporosinus youngiae DSM 17734]
MRDRFYYGFFAGLIAGIPMVLFNLFSYYVLDFAQMRLLDWMSIILYGRLPLNAFDSILAQVVHFGFLGFLGIAFAYYVPLVRSRHYLFKGWVFSLSVFSLLYATTLFFQVPGLEMIQPYTVASNLISSTIFGLTLAEAAKRIVSTEPRSQ